MTTVARWLRLWFTFESPVDRRTYLVSGLFLAPLKYAGDALLVWLTTGRFWDPVEYLTAVSALSSPLFKDAPPTLLMLLGLWSLPFLWIGLSMSMRRALDAGETAWFSLFFFVPFIKYLFIAGMCAVPSKASEREGKERPRRDEARLPSAMMAITAGLTVGLGMLALSVYGLKTYGWALFFATPFVIGALTAFLFNRRYPATSRETNQIVMLTLAAIGGALLMTAVEGAICLAMAAPLSFVIGVMGSALGREIAWWDRVGVGKSSMLIGFVLPVSAFIDSRQPATDLREVRSSIEIDATPDVVWRHVIAFPPMAEPSDLVFRLGLAYPQRAEIIGEGLGAVRYCVFSTGAFVEPITRWEPGRRLSFDVTEQPKPMQEWSPYADISPPHMDGYFRSRRGEFRLVPLPNGRTRLEGSTWYEMRLQPAGYWALYGDALIGRIHRRVLSHIQATVADSVRQAAGARVGARD